MPKDYLRILYNDNLNSEGDVEIENSSFQRSQILLEIEPETYDISFEDWKQQHEIDLKQKAEDILELYDNSKRFEKLKRVFDSGNITPFIGAGLSMASNFPSWTAFLYQMCDESDLTTAQLTQLLQSGKYEEAAQEIFNDLGNVLFNEHLENEFSSEKNVLGAINYMPFLFKKTSVITTNFDNVIEKTYLGTDSDFDEVKGGFYLDEVLKKIVGGSRVLVKLHGDCRQIQDRVLTQQEYENAYSEKGQLKEFFKRFMYSGSMLFLGCSLTNDRTIMTMKEIVAENGADTLPRHYAFIEEIKDEKKRKQKKKDLAKANIFPIWYLEEEHDESIEALFLKLMEGNS